MAARGVRRVTFRFNFDGLPQFDVQGPSFESLGGDRGELFSDMTEHFAGTTPQDMLKELAASKASRRRARENFQEIRWVVKDTVGIELPHRYARRLGGRIVKDGVRKALRDRRLALAELVHATKHFRQVADSKPLTLQGANYAQAVQELNKTIDRADRLLLG